MLCGQLKTGLRNLVVEIAGVVKITSDKLFNRQKEGFGWNNIGCPKD